MIGPTSSTPCWGGNGILIGVSAWTVAASTLTLKHLCWPLLEKSQQPLAPKWWHLLLSNYNKYLDFTGTTGSGRTKPANFPLYYQRIPKPIFQKQIIKSFLWTKITNHWSYSGISHCGSKTQFSPNINQFYSVLQTPTNTIRAKPKHILCSFPP